MVDQAGRPGETVPAPEAPDRGIEEYSGAGVRPVSIEVALATFNSARYLPELLDSLFGQTFQGFTLLVSDDRSSDSTLDIVSDYQRRYPGRIRVLDSAERTGGPLANFSRLIDHLDADYAFFCDHDDVWLPDKIALCLDEMRSLEARHGPSTPLLVHTDLTVVDADLEILSPSSFLYQNIDPTRTDLPSLLMVNTVSGCAAMANRPLYERARPVPSAAAMHDHWLALVAASVGRISCIEQSTVLYRQHGHNAIGATRWGAASVLDRIRQTLFEDTKKNLLQRFSMQAQALLSRCGDDLDAEQYRAVSALARLWSVNRTLRFILLWRHRVRLRGAIRNSALFLAVSGRRPRSHEPQPSRAPRP